MMIQTTPVSDPSLADRLAQFVTDSIEWVTGHSAQILLAGTIGAVIVALLLAARWVGWHLCATDPGHDHWRTVIGKALAKMRLWFMIAVAAEIVARYAHAPDDLAQTVHFLFVITATMQAAIFLRELILGSIELRATGHESLGSALNVIRLIVTIVLFALAAILILSNIGVNVTGLVAGLGIGGIAIGLAAQGIFADLFAALAILFDRPFRRGDAITVEGVSGNIEEIGLKSTRIRALSGELVIIANKQLLEKEIHNLAQLEYRRIKTAIGLIYQTPVATLAQIAETLGAVVESVDKCTLVRCGISGFGESSIDIDLQYDVHAGSYQETFDARHRVNIAILKRFAELEIEFAYPTQTTMTPTPTPTPTPTRQTSSSDKRKITLPLDQ